MNELTFENLLQILRKSLWIMVAVMLLFAVAAYAFCNFVAVPTYQAKASFIATNGGINVAGDGEDASTIKSSDLAASLALVNTYVGILETNGVYDKVAQHKDIKKLGYSALEIKSMTEVTSRDEEALFIDIVVTSKNATHSVEIVNTILAVGGDFVKSKMPNAYIQPVEESSSAIQNYPNTPTSVVLAAGLGFVLVYGIVLLIQVLDKTIKGEENFTQNYDIPVLGSIPNFKLASKGEKTKYGSQYKRNV